jgi:hypothetical protein
MTERLMNKKSLFSKLILPGLLLFIATSAIAEIDPSFLEMSDQLDGIDKQDFQSAIDKANACTRARNFPCAEAELSKAAKAANTGQDKKTLQASQNGLSNEKQQLANEIRRAEEERQAQNRRDEEERQAQLKRNKEREARLWREKREAQDAADRKAHIAYNASLFSNLQNNISYSMAQAEAGSRGSSVEEDRAKARKLSEFNDILSDMRADPNSELNQDNRARERERAEKRRSDTESTARRDAAKKVALADAAKQANDKRTQADAEANIRKKQKADELKAQQEQERRRAETERRNQELRASAERERVAAAEEAKRKAEKEREAKAEKEREQQAEKQARAQFLQSVAAGTRLVATKCPDGEGKYYATGTRPRPKPEVVSCVDVRFRAYCPGDRIHFSEGTANNFTGMVAGCFAGDTYEINPKPGCKVNQVRIEVVEALECSK